ncbi:glycosyltransferase [Thermoplasmatales archaeon SCGC AB-539-C06]|nr:glycosyltransferase [Thermoplasmatales archaeon SCGC AB-539-C06]
MKKGKIIHISQSAYNTLQTLNIKTESDDFITWSWSKRTAYNMLKYTDEYEVECWRPEPNIKKPIVREIKGVTFKVFPCFWLKGTGIISRHMFGTLKQEKMNYNIILDLHNVHNIQSYFLSLFFKDIPIIMHHHGSYQPIVAFRNHKDPIYLFLYLFDKISLKYIDYFSVISKVEKDYLIDKYDADVILEQGRIDFNKWKPIDKNIAKEKLNIPSKRKVIIYVGKYFQLKGVDVVLKTYKELKKVYNVELILIGGSLNDPLYNKVMSSGAKVYHSISNDELVHYYSAADVFLFPSFNDLFVKYGGFGTAPIEALACNIPIVSSQLIHFRGKEKEAEKIGKIPKNEDDVVKCVSEIFNNPSKYDDCREIAKKYYDVKRITTDLIEIYNRLFEEYYNK